jgi:hypothetical protein
VPTPVVEDGLVGEIDHHVRGDVLENLVERRRGIASRADLDASVADVALSGELLPAPGEQGPDDVVAVRAQLGEGGFDYRWIVLAVDYDNRANRGLLSEAWGMAAPAGA